jgi:hypothetical protein
VARPRKTIDPRLIELEKQVENYARIGCSDRDIGDMLGVAHTTIARRYAPILIKARSESRSMLRKWQMDLARKGNATMLIWLGKNVLKQSDNPISSENPEPIVDETMG